MLPDPHLPYSRRLFLQQGLVLASLLPTVPSFIQQSALGMMLPLGAGTTSQPGVPEDRVLVIVQLAGGNDGLNAVVPYGDPAYYNARPQLGIAAPGQSGGQGGGPGGGRAGNTALATPLDGIGLHPNLASFKELMDEGVASVVQGVGYPNPNRSHFASTDIWETGQVGGKGTGWVGRYFDCTCNGTPDPQAAIAIGRKAPLALMGSSAKPVSFESAELFRWLGEDVHKSLAKPYDEITRAGQLPDVEADTQLAFLMRTALDAQVSSDRIRAAVAKSPLVQYPQSPLARQLRIVGAMIRDGLSTRVYYVSLGGFDTHAGQAGTHGNLMRQLGDSLAAFHRDLKAQGNNGRVMTMVFSEFGRRVKQNASQGTDHGTAAPMFLMGDMVAPGVLGRHPSLTDLDQGDLKFTLDFRSVYAGILEDWMGAPSEKILGGKFQKAKVVKT